LKKKTMGHHRDRNAQFERIARLKKKYLKARAIAPNWVICHNCDMRFSEVVGRESGG
jgi:hypothetical protein